MKSLKEVNSKNNIDNNDKEHHKNEQENENEYQPINISENYIPSNKVNQYIGKRNNINFIKIVISIFLVVPIFLIIIYGIYYYVERINKLNNSIIN